MTRVVAVMGAYNQGGTVDSMVEAVLDAARELGAETEKIDLVDRHIEFCRNCFACVAPPGPDRGPCVLDGKDDMSGILAAIEAADALVLASPVNCGDVTARTRQFMERCVGHFHWPVDQAAPRARRPDKPRRAVLLVSSAAPSLLTRWLSSVVKTLRLLAGVLGARTVDVWTRGLNRPPRSLDAGDQARARRAARRLLRA